MVRKVLAHVHHTCALNIRYFFVTDQVEKGNLSIEYCPTDEMLGDFMTKPLQGSKFSFFKSRLMGNDEWVPVTRKKRTGRSMLEKKIHLAWTPGTRSVELQY